MTHVDDSSQGQTPIRFQCGICSLCHGNAVDKFRSNSNLHEPNSQTKNYSWCIDFQLPLEALDREMQGLGEFRL